MIKEGEGDAEEHVCDAEDDGELHLHGVCEGDLVLRHLPDGVKADGVRRPRVRDVRIQLQLLKFSKRCQAERPAK